MVFPEISIVLPCRNEEKAISFCIKEIKRVIKENDLKAEIVVSDSSSDNSYSIAKSLGVNLIKHDKEGYGNALIEGFKISKGKYIIFLDADGSYDFDKIPVFVNSLKKGNDLVVGDRFSGEMENGAMPMINKYLGNPLLSFLTKLFFGSKLRDSQCGMRAIKKDALNKLNLQTTGMEFASEMIIKSIKNNFRIAQISVNYKKRIGKSKLRRIGDGWRNLRFLLLYSPFFLFFLPGFIIFIFGVVSLLLAYFDKLSFFGVNLIIHPMFLFSSLVFIGYQLMFFSFFSKIYAINHLGEKSNFNQVFHYLNLERGILIGGVFFVLGAIIYLNIFIKWFNSGFGDLNQFKNSIIALTFFVIGFQTIFSSFVLSILGIKEK